ncbi:hypothetical protein J6590_068262 [Homalodisca vitripennis]|nr:hypothetical protein J6590_068262 [Homalodisca vitripennis]
MNKNSAKRRQYAQGYYGRSACIFIVPYDYISSKWRKTNVSSYPRQIGIAVTYQSWRQISISSFMLKGTEKVLDQFIESELERIEGTIEAKDTAIRVFVDIEGVFGNIYKFIKRAAQIPPYRMTTVRLEGLSVMIKWTKGYPRGVLSPSGH